MKNNLFKALSFFTIIFTAFSGNLCAAESSNTPENTALNFVQLIEPLELKTILNPELPLRNISLNELEQLKPCKDTTVSNLIVFLWCTTQKMGEPDFQPFGITNLKIKSQVIKSQRVSDRNRVVVESNIYNKSNNRIIKSKNRVIELKNKGNKWKISKQTVIFN